MTSCFLTRLDKNRSLYKDLQIFETKNKEQTAEILNLKDQISSLTENKEKTEKSIASQLIYLDSVKNKVAAYENKIADLTVGSDELTGFSNALENKIKELELERAKLQQREHDLSFELANISQKLRNRDEQFAYTTKQLIEATTQLKCTTEQLEEMCEELKAEKTKNKQIKKQWERDNRLIAGVEYKIKAAVTTLNSKEMENERLRREEEGGRLKNEKLVEDNTMLFAKLENIKGHVFVLTEQNKKLAKELEIIGDQDERMALSLARKKQIVSLVKENESMIWKSKEGYESRVSGFN